MERTNLDCCVVRDLLPAYIEELTEEETSAQVAAHLEGCPACRAVEADMRAQMPMEQAPKRALRFLKRVRRTRLVAAAVTIVLCLWCIWWLYDQATFCYPNTEAGRLSAVTDYVLDEEDDLFSSHGIPAGTPVQVLGHAIVEDQLFIAYAAEDQNHIHGVVRLVRGINGKYRPMDASLSPTPYTAVIDGGVLPGRTQDLEGDYYFLMGSNCREIYSVRVEFCISEYTSLETKRVYHTFDIEEPSFFWVMTREELREMLGLESLEEGRLFLGHVQLLDKEGNDVTDQYRDETVLANWGGSRGTAEGGLLYFYIGLVAVLGLIFVQYFLRKD